ncbi:cold-shock protein [Inquilinus sp. CA228]|uniref:cold-shock protein n=1 Tax=Inquilinus sp. CA228 TaxID=3455609 RepID=UPI003F8D5DCB
MLSIFTGGLLVPAPRRPERRKGSAEQTTDIPVAPHSGRDSVPYATDMVSADRYCDRKHRCPGGCYISESHPYPYVVETHRVFRSNFGSLFFVNWASYFLGISTGIVHDYRINSGYRASALRPLGAAEIRILSSGCEFGRPANVEGRPGQRLRKEEFMATGTVKWFDAQRGFGFITQDDGGKDAFVHITAVERSGLGQLSQGQRLGFDLVADQRSGKPSADNLKAVD